MPYYVMPLALLFSVILAYQHKRQRKQLRQRRSTFFQACLPQFENIEVQQDSVNYPVLRGNYRGFPVQIEPLVDHISFRKLPQLWALVTLRVALPRCAIVDVLARPSNMEFYSPASRLPFSVKSEPGWPVHAQVRTSNVGRLPPCAVLDRCVCLFHDQKLKELLIFESGLRLVYQLQEGSRSHYLVLRQAVFDDARLNPQLVARLLDVLIAAYADIRAGTQSRNLPV
jgi:hypothetical protein